VGTYGFFFAELRFLSCTCASVVIVTEIRSTYSGTGCYVVICALSVSFGTSVSNIIFLA
jgi:hypothetical protein